MMLSVKQTRDLLQDDSLSDDEVRIIRDAAYELASVLIDHWLSQVQGGDETDSAVEENMV